MDFCFEMRLDIHSLKKGKARNVWNSFETFALLFRLTLILMCFTEYHAASEPFSSQTKSAYN